MPIVAVVLFAAVLHATWNAIVKSIDDRLAAMAAIGVASVVVCVPVVALATAPAAASVPFIATSVITHGLYYVLLIRAYRDSDFNQVYPLARGVSPPTVAVCAVLFVGERFGAAQIAGLVAVTAGLLGVAAGPRGGSRRGLAFAVMTGLVIAGYTVLDGIGVRRSGTALGYTGWLFVAEGMVMPIVWLSMRAGAPRRPAHPPGRDVWLRGAVAGVLSVAAYGLVLWAQTRGALAIVAALRETSVVFGALIGATVFREGMGWRRALASALIAGGAVMLAAA